VVLSRVSLPDRNGIMRAGAMGRPVTWPARAGKGCVS